MKDVESQAQSPQSADWSAELVRHERWLRAVIGARCGEAQAVDEIWQEVALAVVAQKAPLRDTRRVAPWLYQLAVRQALMYRRRCGRQRNLRQRFADVLAVRDQSGASSPTGDPLQWLLLLERGELIRQALRRLPPKDAELLTLKYTQDWSYRQMSEHLGLSHHAVESRLHRARQKLREQLAVFQVIEVNS